MGLAPRKDIKSMFLLLLCFFWYEFLSEFLEMGLLIFFDDAKGSVFELLFLILIERRALFGQSLKMCL